MGSSFDNPYPGDKYATTDPYRDCFEFGAEGNANRRCPFPVNHQFGGLSNSTGLHTIANIRATNHRPNNPMCNPIRFDGKQLEIHD